MTRYAVITFVMLAIGRSAPTSFAQSTWPVVTSSRMPSLALTRAGAPVTLIAGTGGGTTLARAAAFGGTFAETFWEEATRLSPLVLYATPGAAEHPATSPTTSAPAHPAKSVRGHARITLRCVRVPSPWLARPPAPSARTRSRRLHRIR